MKKTQKKKGKPTGAELQTLALKALRKAVRGVWKEARMNNRPLAIWKDGKVVTVYPAREK